MKVLVFGASGKTGRLLVRQLLERGAQVSAVVRSKTSSSLDIHDRLTVLEASLTQLTDDEIMAMVSGCDAVASCLGHNMTWRGIFGPPYRLVTDAVRRLCHAALNCESNRHPVRLVLMNTAGHRDQGEQVSLSERCVTTLLRLLVPPHADNEKAADYLRYSMGAANPFLEWVAVRPDTLGDEPEVSDYDLHPAPTRSAIFNAGSTSRINVAHYMAELIMNDEAWDRWKGQMPVIYNRAG